MHCFPICPQLSIRLIAIQYDKIIVELNHFNQSILSGLKKNTWGAGFQILTLSAWWAVRSASTGISTIIIEIKIFPANMTDE